MSSPSSSNNNNNNGLSIAQKYQLSPFLIDATAGLCGGTALVYASQPFDTVKVKLQAFPEVYNRSMITCFRKTLANEGIRKGLYRGSVPAIGVNALENMVLFACYEQFTKVFKPKKLHEQALLGSASAVFSSLVVCPTELIKIRMQAAYELNNKNESTAQLLKKIFYEKKIPGLGYFQGLTSCWYRECPGYFFFFYGKETANQFLKNNYGNKATPELIAITSGTLAGICFWSAMLPFDNVKTNYQVMARKDASIIKMFIQTAKINPKSFYNGFWATIIRSIPANIALFYVYDKVREILTT